jgi:gamma-tubulin complex component 3
VFLSLSHTQFAIQVIKFVDKPSGTCEIDIKASLSTPTRGLVLRISEAGWLFRRVSQFSKSRSSLAAGGLMLQGFISGIQDELSEYYRLVAILQAQIGTDSSTSDLTLRKLVVWTQEPLQRLRLMALLCHAAQGKKGGELVSALAAHVRHGDALVNSLCRKLVRPACAPLLQMIRLWVEDGELWDPHDEFFVACDFSLDDRRWKEKYSLRAAMVPSMLSSELARLVLIAGKSINFIRRCCGEVAYAPSVKLPELSQLDIDDVEVC